MPENDPKSPGSAAQSAGSATAGQASAAGGAAGSTAAPKSDPLTEQLSALSRTVETLVKTQENHRSFVDRTFNELRSAVAARPARRVAASATDADGGDSAATGGNGTDPYLAQDIALIKFRQLNTDWNDYWNDMAPILADKYKAAPYAVRGPDGDVDYYLSIQNVKDHIELERLRKQRDEFAKSGANAQNTRNALRRDATISGQSASATEEVVDYEAIRKLPYKERVQKLVELGLIDVDENDLPEALR